MAPQLGNYVLETATAPGTGSFTLNGPETDRRSFSAAFPNGGSVFYFADDGSSAEWGVGTLTIGTPSTLSRTTIIGTTSGGTSVLNFPGSVEVYNEIPAEYVPVLEQDGSLTLAGSLQVQGKALVQKVDDWTAYQAVGAKDADARYLQNYAGTSDEVITRMAFRPSAGAPFIDGFSGAPFFFQRQGDYATNSTVNGKIAKNTGQGPSVDSMGIVSASGQPFCVDSAGKLRYIVKSPGASATDVPIQSVGINNQRIYVSYDNDRKAAWLVRSPAEGSGDMRVGSVGIAGGARPYFGYGGGNDASNALWLAKESDLGNYALLSQLPTDPNKIILAWNGYVGGGDQSIPFPRGLSWVDSVVVVCSRQLSGNHATAVINVQGWNNSSVQVNSVWVAGATQANADVNYRAIVIGNK